MKQKDLLLIAVIVIVSGVFSFVISGFLFGSPQDRAEKVEVVEALSTDFPQPDSKYFNDQSFDPTKPITIGDNANPDPFSGTAQ